MTAGERCPRTRLRADAIEPAESRDEAGADRRRWPGARRSSPGDHRDPRRKARRPIAARRRRCGRPARASRPRRSALAAARRDPGRPGAGGPRRGHPRAGGRPPARGAPGIQAGPAAQGPAADLHRPDPAPRRHRQDDRGPVGRRGDADRAAAVRGLLESIQVAIEDILYRQGVEPFAAEGDPSTRGGSAPSPRRRRTTRRATRRSPPGSARGSRPARS